MGLTGIKPGASTNSGGSYEYTQTYTGVDSNLSALNIFQLYELRKNYKKLNYSITEIDLQLLKLISYPVYLLLISIFASIIMFNIKIMKNQ